MPYMCRLMLLVELWLLVATRLRLLAAEPLRTARPLCPSQYLYGTILMTLLLGHRDFFFFHARDTSFHIHSSHLIYFLCVFVGLHY